MELSEHNWANISETICPEMLICGKYICLLDVVLSEYPDKSHNFTNFIFYDVTLRYSIKGDDIRDDSQRRFFGQRSVATLFRTVTTLLQHCNAVLWKNRRCESSRVISRGTRRIFDRLKNLTGHLVRTEPFNIFALFTRNFERLSV